MQNKTSKHWAKSFVSLVLGSSLVISSVVACIKPLSLDEQREQRKAVESLFTSATKLMRQGEESSYRKAESALRLAQEMSPQDPRLVDGLGCIAFRRGDLDRAAEYFNTALAYDLFYDRAYAHLALVADRQGQQAQARELYQRALELNPLNYRARNNYSALLADNATDSQSLTEAYQELDKAAQLAGGKVTEIKDNLELLESRIGDSK